jgi:hypothetical protein
MGVMGNRNDAVIAMQTKVAKDKGRMRVRKDVMWW